MTTGLTILYRGPEQVEHHQVEFEDNRTPEFSEDTLRYDESTGHWIVSMDEPPTHEVPGWPKPGTPSATPVDVCIPREQVILVNQWKPYDGPQIPTDKHGSNDISAEIIYDSTGENRPSTTPNVLNDQVAEFLEKPSFDSEMNHWTCQFHEFDARDGEGRTQEVTQFIPRERIFYVYTSKKDEGE